MFKKMNLAAKLSIAIGGVLTVILAVLVVSTTLISSSAIRQGVSGELSAVCKSNAQQIQQVFTEATFTAQGLNNYLEWAYQRGQTNPEDNKVSTNPDVAALCQSSIYQRTLSSIGYDAELFITETARNTVKNNAGIEGVGVMFEPYKFETGIRDYAFYVNKENADSTLKPYGSYESYSAEEWYDETVKTKQQVTTDSYDHEGKQIISYSQPLIVNGEVLGVIVVDIDINTFSSIDTVNEKYPTMWSTVYSDRGNIIWTSESADLIGKNVADFTPDQDELQMIKQNMAGTAEFQFGKAREDGKKVSCFYYPIQVGDQVWWSMTGVYDSDLQKTVSQAEIILIALSVAALLLVIFTVVFLLRRMLRPIGKMVQAADQIVAGNLDIQLDNKSDDEIGKLAHAFRTMSRNLNDIISDIGYVLNEMANGNFRVHTKAEESYVGAYHDVLMSMRRINRTLSATLREINTAADQVSAGADQVSAGAQALSQGATEQASSVQELAATIAEVSHNVSSNAERAKEANDKAIAVSNEVSEGNQKMQQTLAAMGEIRGSSAEIAKIIKTIEDIAFQTNILSLNAAVEAARAGAAGKGFAVVADEVRNLAAKSAEAARTTTELIQSSLKAVEHGTESVDDTAQSLNSIVTSIQEITESVQHISTASNEQANAIDQITQGIDQISSVVQTNSATAEESAAASEELSGQAQTLKSLTGRFRLRDDAGNDVGYVSQPTPIADTLTYEESGAGDSIFVDDGKY
ncbi:methyl-accepting chemotaxis protein [Anaerotruncus colihominis]|uniref:methyl-accepting chemotaxis protein n=1 Tax=Anaerotruncus colihominis TaxID=169435 RepID=UPI0018978DF8|nr:methyl-accepting chemotaxis protein [Anaerotruncus colihominis]MBS4860877.1 HAMP domain-containing protein [Eubacterium limosum]